MDPRFNTARFGPWSNGPISDPNSDPVGSDTVKPGNTDPGALWNQEYEASLGGGGLYGGAGLDGGWSGASGGGGFSAATMAFDDGGVIPSSFDNEADGTEDQTGTVDPFNMIRKAVQDFRQKMGGQPRVFYPDESSQEDTQSFDEGGSVEQSPDQDQQGVVGPGPKPVDPRETTKYLAGDGAIQPAVALALEQMTDPQRQMQPGQRMMATAQMLAQKSPDAAGAYLQAKRILFNGFAGATSSALKKGDMALAAHNATQAFANVPNSHNVKFAPHPHGLVMHAQPHQGGATPQQAQPEQPEAPQVDNDAQEQVQSAAGGGVIETDETNPSALYQQQQPGSAASYDEGGDVEDGDEVTGTVTPQQPEWLQGAQQARPAPTPPPAADERSLDQIAIDRPTPLSTEQAAAVVHPEAFDKVVDKGWLRYLAEKVGLGGRMAAGAADTAYTGVANVARSGQEAVKQGVSDVGTGLEEGYTGKPVTPKPATPPAGEETPDDLTPATKGGKFFNPVDVDPNRPDNNPNIPRSALARSSTPTSRPTPAQGARAVDAQGRNTDEIAAAGGQSQDEEARVTKREDMLDRLAMKRFPWLAGDAHAREAYKAQLRSELYKTDQATGKFHYEEKAKLQDQKHAGEMEKAKYVQSALNMRNANSTANRYGIAQMAQISKSLQSQNHDLMTAVMKRLSDNPGMSPEEALTQVKGIAPKGIDPGLLRDTAHYLLFPHLYQQQGQGQGQPAPQSQGQNRPQSFTRQDGTVVRLQPDGSYK